MEKVVLGFSGGLDTTFCAKYLSEDKGLEVHSVVVNTGGFDEAELKKIEAHAYALGVKSHTTIQAVEGYYDRIIKYLIYGNILKNNTYPLSVSAERLSQSLHIAAHVKNLDAKLVAEQRALTAEADKRKSDRLARLRELKSSEMVNIPQVGARCK